MQTIGVRARETARIAYEMLEENGAPTDEIGADDRGRESSDRSSRTYRRLRDRQRDRLELSRIRQAFFVTLAATEHISGI